MTSTPKNEEELARAYAMVQADLKKLDVFQVYLFGDGSAELSTEWQTDNAAFGNTLYEAVRNLRKDNAAAR